MKKITPGIGSATQKTPVYQILCDSLNFSMLPVWARIMKRTVLVNRLKYDRFFTILHRGLGKTGYHTRYWS